MASQKLFILVAFCLLVSTVTAKECKVQTDCVVYDCKEGYQPVCEKGFCSCIFPPQKLSDDVFAKKDDRKNY